MGRMYLSDKYCPACNTRLKLSRMTLRLFCEKCREFKDIEKTNIGLFNWLRVRCD